MINCFGFFATLVLFVIFSKTKNEYIKKIPIMISVGIVLIVLLKIFNISYETYCVSANILSSMIAPATIALAYPMYKNSEILVQNKSILYPAVLVGVFSAIVSTYFCAKFFGADIKIISSLMPKSTTMPIALEISKSLGGYLEITACTVALTGIFGGVFGHKILKFLKIKSNIAIGMAMGSASHVIGTSACIERKNNKQTTASTIALITVGLISAIIIPLLKKWL